MSGGPEVVDLGSIDETIGPGPNCIPCIGMEFDTEEEAYLFYKNYGKMAGFSIKKQYCHKSKVDGVVNNRKYTCSKEGKRSADKRDINVRKHRAETRTLCLAQMQILLNRKSGKYVVTSWNDDHNHPLNCAACTHGRPSQRSMSGIRSIDVGMAENAKNSAPLESDHHNVEEVPKEREGGKQASSSSTTSQSAQHRKRNRATNTEDEPLAKILDKLGEVAVALGKLTEDRLVVSKLYDEVMKTEGFDEEFLASAFDHLVQNEMLGKAFLAKNYRLRKLWLEKFRTHLRSIFVGAHVKW